MCGIQILVFGSGTWALGVLYYTSIAIMVISTNYSKPYITRPSLRFCLCFQAADRLRKPHSFQDSRSGAKMTRASVIKMITRLALDKSNTSNKAS